MKTSRNSLAILAGIIAVASVQTLVNCESNCDDNSKLQYEAGKSYVYQLILNTFDPEGRRMAHGASKDSQGHSTDSRHHVHQTMGKISTKGSVVLTALENCQFVLTLNNVTQELAVERNSGNAPHDAAEITVPRTSIKFSYKNGEVSALQASQKGGVPWTENIIRGILTMIQNKAMSNADGEPEERETNIKGDCLSHVKIPNEGTYKKHIHMGDCSEAMVSPSCDGVPYTNPIYSPVSGLHHSRSHLSCIQTVKEGMLHTVNCTEQDEVPLIKGRMDTLSSFYTTTFNGEEPSKVGGATTEEISSLTRQISIHYDISPNVLGEGEVFFEEIGKVAEKMYLDRNANKAEYFLKLKEMLASITDFPALEAALNKAGGENPLQIQFTKNIIREVATEVGTEAAVVHLANLVDKPKELEWGTLSAFFGKLPYSRHPTLNGLRALLGNLEGAWGTYQNDTFISFHFTEKKRIRIMLLGVSAYAYQYCRQHPECGSLTEYQEIVNQISMFCDTKQIEISPACAHALGNVEHLPSKAVENIKHLLLSTGELLTGNNKKITAFEAFRRDPCQQELKTLARDNLENMKNSQEMRIVAYLAVARCPQEDDLTVIDTILSNEFDTPLSSFIATHVYNMIDSQSPSKLYMKNSLLGQIGIPENVPKVHNSPTSSRFIEYSTFRPEKNLGFSASGHIIFMDDGTEEPMFAHLNLTLDFLGKSYNKFEVGLSKRYFPRVEKLNRFLKRFHGEWMGRSMFPALFGVDSFYRVFGTTVSMGIDIFDSMKPHEFFDRVEDKETGLLRLDLVKPFTFMDKDFIFPTIAGLPVTFSAQAAYLPVLSMNHTGDPNGLGLMDLLSKWDEKSGEFRHNSTLDSSFYAKVSVSAGKGTPNSMANNLEVKVHCNHSIGYESRKTLNSNWVKRVEFPDMIVWSQTASLTKSFSTTHWANQNTHLTVFGDIKSKLPRRLFEKQAMGLKLSVEMLKEDSLMGSEILIKVEKTEDKFTGYSLDVQKQEADGHLKSIAVALKADGLSTVDTVQFSFAKDIISPYELQEDSDRPKSEYTISSEYTHVGGPATGFKFHYFSEGFPKSSLNLRSSIPPELEVSSLLSFISLGLVTRSKYLIEFDVSTNNKQIRYIDWNVENTNKDSTQAILKFGGALEPTLGTITGHVSNPVSANDLVPTVGSPSQEVTTINADISLNSMEHGLNKVTLDFNNDIKATALNSSANIHGHDYHLIQTYLKRPSFDTPKFSQSLGYTALYKDSFGRNLDLNFTHSQENEKKFFHIKNTLTLTGTPLEGPIVANMNMHTEHESSETGFHLINSDSTHFDIDLYNGKKKGDLKYDIKYSHSSNNNEASDTCNGVIFYNMDGTIQCSTHTTVITSKFTEMYDFSFNFTNDSPLKTEVDIRVDHVHPKFHGDLHTIFERDETAPQSKFTKTSKAHMNHWPEHHDNWEHSSVSKIDLQERTYSQTSETTRNSKDHWNLKMDANWPENLANGDTKLNLVHTCPAKRTLNLNVLNEARPGEIFNNTLIATWNITAMTREYIPKKQLTWILTKDDKMTTEEQAKHESKLKLTNDILLENLGDGGSNPNAQLFHVIENFQMTKAIGKEDFSFVGDGNVVSMGKQKADWNYQGGLEISQTHEVESTFTSSTPSTLQKLPGSIFKLESDGWFEIGTPEMRNNTWKSRYTTKFVPEGTRWLEDFEFLYQKLEENSNLMFSVDVNGTKDFHFKDWVHWQVLEKATIVVDNKTSDVMKDIKLDGPHLSIYMKYDSPTNSENNNEDAWIIDFAGGVYQEKHQHKFNLRNSGSPKHHHHHHPHHQNNGTYLPTHRKGMPFHHRPGGFGLFSKNYNYTISK